MSTEKAKTTIVAIIFSVLLIAVLLMALAISFSAFRDAGSATLGSQNRINTLTIPNETGRINSGGYTLVGSPLVDNEYGPVLISLLNGSNLSQIIALGNATFYSDFGIINASAKLWDNASITYSILYNTSITNYSVATNNIMGGVVGMVVNFVALLPITGTILAVSILIGIIVLLVVYVRKAAKSNDDGSSFQG